MTQYFFVILASVVSFSQSQAEIKPDYTLNNLNCLLANQVRLVSGGAVIGAAYKGLGVYVDAFFGNVSQRFDAQIYSLNDAGELIINLHDTWSGLFPRYVLTLQVDSKNKKTQAAKGYMTTAFGPTRAECTVQLYPSPL